MTASIHVQSIVPGESFPQNSTFYAPISASVEGSNNQAKSVTKIREAGVFDLGFVRAVTNSLSGSCTVTLQKNGVDTAVTISISAAATGAFHDATNSFSVAADDEVGWEIVCAAGTGTIELTLLGFRFTPTNTSNCVTFASCFKASSSAFTTANTFFLPPNGSRDFDTTEAVAQQRIQRAAAWRGLYTVQGSNTRDSATDIGVRVNGADNATLAVQVPAASTAIQEDNVGSISLSADDLFNYFVRTSAGTGTYNLERINTELVSTEGKFFLFAATAGSVAVTTVRYFPLAGELASSATEANVEFVAKSSFRLSQLLVDIPDITSGTQNGATIRVRKNGANTDLAVRVNTIPGLYQDNVHFVDVVADDRVCIQVDDPSGNIFIQNMGLVGDVTGAGGGGAPESTPIAWDASTNGGGFTTTSPHTFLHRPFKVNPQAVVVAILQGDSTDRVTAVTYGGVSMTRLPTHGFAVDAAGEPCSTYVYTLLSGIPEGNQTVSITHDGNAVSKRAFCLTFKADADLEVVASGMVQGDTDDPGVALDSSSRTAVRFYATMSGLGNVTNIAPKTGYTQAGEDVGPGTSRLHNVGYQTAAGAGSSTAGVDTSAADDVALVALALAEVEGAGTTEEVSHTTNSLLKATFERSHTTDALLGESQSLTHTSNARLWATLARTHTANSLLKKTLEKSHSTDATMESPSASNVIFRDFFTEGVSVALETHTPDIGTSWTKVGAIQLNANGNLVMPGSTVASSAALYTCSPNATERDIDVEIDVLDGQFAGGTDDPFQLFGRYSESGGVASWYAGGAYQNGNASNLRIWKKVGATVTELASADFNIPAGGVFTLSIRGPVTATVVRILINGTERLIAAAQNEPTISGLGYGVGLGNNSGVATDDANSSWAFEDILVTEYSSEFENSKLHTTNALLKKTNDVAHTTDADIRRQRLHRTDSLLAVPTIESVVFRDTFTTSINTALESHAPDEGTSWFKIGTEGLFVEASSHRMGLAGPTVASSNAFYACNPQATGESVDVFVTLKTSLSGQPGGTDDPFMLFARISGTSFGAWYSAGCYQNALTNNIRIVKSVNGVRTEIASGHQNLALNDEIRLRVRGPATATIVSLIINGNEVLVAPLQNEPAISANRGGFGLGNNWTNVNADANQSWTFDDFQISEFSTDITKTRDHVTDALIEKVFERDHTTNALKKRTSAPAHTTNALLGTGLFRTHSTDAELWQPVTPVTGVGPMGLPRPAVPGIQAAAIEIDQLHQTTALLRKEFDRDHTSSALLRKAFDRSHSTDATTTAAPFVTHLTDGALRRTQEVGHGTDGLTVPAVFRIHQTDAYLIITSDIQHDTDALIEATVEVSHTTDAQLVGVSVLTRGHLTDSLLQSLRQHEHTTNALIGLSVAAVHTADALLLHDFEVIQTTDGHLRITASNSHTADCFLKDTIELVHSTSALLDDATSEHHGTDAALAGTPEVSHSADSFTVSLGALTHTGDAFIQKSTDLDHESDAFLQIVVSQEHVTDSLLLRVLSLDHETDAGIWWIEDVIHVTDAFLLFPQVGHGTDAFLRMGLQTPKEGIVRSLNPILTVRKL